MPFDFKKLSILVVEDTAPMRKLITSVLETLGVGRVYSCDNGEAGFDLFRRESPDIVIADWHMLPMSGIELTEQKTEVLALHMAYVDTDLTRGFDVPKSTPEAIVKRALDGLEAGLDEVLADEITEHVKHGLIAARPSYLPQHA